MINLFRHIETKKRRLKTLGFFLLGKYSALFYPLVWMDPAKRSVAVRRDTEIVIEGFPRSGNTFATAAFLVSQNRQVKIARHLHAPVQIPRGVKKKLPVILLIRKPSDAVISFVLREPHIGISEALKLYIRFYSCVLPYLPDTMIVRFEQLVQSFDEIIPSLNAKFGTSFIPFENSEDNKNACFRLIEIMDQHDNGSHFVNETTVARPSPQREKLKLSIKDKLESTENKVLLTKANLLYQAITGIEV